ncbi:ATP-binding protein [Halomonas sp. A29]|uniref:ATP-binding protein n=1 Tax=Halomonas sp. A29 TaxID=3102786 RepID=UPI00398B2651
MTGSPSLRYRIAAFAAVLLFCSALLTAKIIHDRQQQLEHRMLEDLTWSSYQFDREVRELRMALKGGAFVDRDAVLLRYEILLSRAGLLGRGELKQALTQTPLGHPLEDSTAMVTALDPLMARLESDDGSFDHASRQALEKELLKLQDRTSRLLLDINAHVGMMRTQERDHLWLLYKVLLVLIVLLMVAGSILVVSLIHEGRANRKRRDLLEVQARDLDAAVQRAEHASQAKSEFMAVMSHEIRTPLGGVVGVAELLAFEPLTARGTQLLETLNDSLVGLQAVINDVIDYTKYESGSLDLHPQPFLLREFIAQLSRHYRMLGESRSLAFEVEVGAEVPACLEGDTTRMGQVLMNLLNNAFKFTSAGRVRLEARWTDDQALFLSVSDTGCGISEQSQPHIFKPFAQADSTIARRYGGSGLGLAICERLVTAMQGRIGFESSAGVGSRFWISLPLRVLPPNEAAQVSQQLSLAGSSLGVLPRGRILVVEDQPANRELAKALLERLGQIVQVAADGQAGLDAMTRYRFDLVLMDMQMPIMDGLETTRCWRRQEPAGQPPLPIVALTANAMPSARQRCLEAGMNDVLCKPYTRHDLQRVLVQWLVPMAGARAVEEVDSTSAEGGRRVSAALDVELDRDMLLSLEEVLGEGALRSLVQRFIERLRADLETLQRSLYERDRKGLREYAHSLKGSASALGCRGLAHAAAELERLADGAVHDVLEEEVARLMRIGSMTHTALAQLGYLEAPSPSTEETVAGRAFGPLLSGGHKSQE